MRKTEIRAFIVENDRSFGISLQCMLKCRGISADLFDSAQTFLDSVPSGQKGIAIVDITYIWTNEGWLYLAVVLDLFSRQVVGWSMSNRIVKKLMLDAFLMAVWQRRPESGLVFHSDRGSQYCSTDFQKALKNNRMLSSMSRKGDCWDNSVAESFFGSLKIERVFDSVYRTREEARRDIVDYIEMFYNSKRRHSYLGYLSPKEFEKQMALKKAAF